MRLLHLAKYYPPAIGGMETFVRDLAEAQTAQGHEVVVLAHADASPVPPQSADARPRIVRSPVPAHFFYAPLAPAFPFQLRALLRDFAPDAVIAHLPNLSAFWLLALPCPPPVILFWHADVVASAIDRKMALLSAPYRLPETALLRRAAAVVATSRPYLESSPSLRPFADKSRVIHLGADLRRFAPPPPEEAAALRRRLGHDRLVVSVGRCTYYKGFQHLVRAAAELDAGVVILGDGQERPGLLKLARDLGVADRVSLPGRVSDREVLLHLAACDVFCLPSVERTEAFGLSLLEAMAMGKPVVSTDIPGSGVGVVNEAGVTGLCARRADPSDLARALAQLLDDPARRAAMGAAARHRAERLFDIRRTASELTDLAASLSPRQVPSHALV